MWNNLKQIVFVSIKTQFLLMMAVLGYVAKGAIAGGGFVMTAAGIRAAMNMIFAAGRSTGAHPVWPPLALIVMDMNQIVDKSCTESPIIIVIYLY